MTREALHDLVARQPLVDGQLIYAVDISVWPRCDAETNPQRGYYYHPSRHSSGKPIVAGSAYQWINQLGFAFYADPDPGGGHRGRSPPPPRAQARVQEPGDVARADGRVCDRRRLRSTGYSRCSKTPTLSSPMSPLISWASRAARSAPPCSRVQPTQRPWRT